MQVVIPQCPELWHGYFKFLAVAKEAAVTSGNTVTVLEPFPCAAVDEFRKHYRHNSPNPPWFEKWCFEQWLLLADWMEKNAKEVVFKIDSDCLVFTNLQRLWESGGKPMYTLPTPESFITRKGAKTLSDFIVETFRAGKELQLCEKDSCLCDGHLINPFKRLQGAVDLQSLERACDTGLYNTHKGPEFEGHKDVWFVQGQPCWLRPQGYTRMLSIHCWGWAKHNMDVIWRQAMRSIAGPPVRLTIGIEPPHVKTP